MNATEAKAVATRQRRTQAERREEAERLILDAAIRIVAEKGLDAFTLADAGEAAGYSRGLPAHYFRSKAELLSAITNYIREWFFAGLRARVGNQHRGLSSLIAGIDFYFDACGADRTMLLALHTVLAGALHKPALADAVARLNRESAEAIEVAILNGIASGEIHRDIDAKAWSVLVLASVRGVIAQWLIDPGHVDLPSLRDGVVASLKGNLAIGTGRAFGRKPK